MCNGHTVAGSDGAGNITTPDHGGRFMIGVSDTYALSSLGGEASASVSTSEDGEHSHAVTVDAGGAHAHTGTVQGTALTAAPLPVHSHLNVLSGIGNATLPGSNSLSHQRPARAARTSVVTGKRVYVRLIL